MTLREAAFAQTSRSKASKGPRALGLLQFLPGGKARLIPVVILIDGQYYDAGAYKASPVPMALWSETVYEGFRTGISQGIFTVGGALENQKTNEWIAEGTWQTAESLAAKSSKKPSPTIPRGLEDDSGPPTLRHSAVSKPKPPETPPASAPAEAPTPSQPTAATPTPPPPASATSSASSSAESSPSITPDQKEPEDPNRPTLKRGKPVSTPAPSEPEISPAAPAAKGSAHTPPAASSKAAPAQLIPAISDADGPEAHSYIYDLKPEEQLALRNQVVALAVDEVRLRAKQLTSQSAGSPETTRDSKSRAATRAKPEPPSFEDVVFRVFDLSSSNEPTMVFTASAKLPERAGQNGSANLQYFVTLVARQDVNGDVHKAFSNVTDTQHLDVEPKFELIDAVDVDGDGRAELLFRKVYDASSAFAVYRVIGDQLYALFDGNPG